MKLVIVMQVLKVAWMIRNLPLDIYLSRHEELCLSESAKQFVIAYSTMEAEYVACYEATRHAVWLRNFIRGLGVVYSIEMPIMMYCDETVAVSFSNNFKGTSSARYIDVKYFVVKEKVEEGIITVVHTTTYNMVVDPLIKALQ